MFDINGDSTAAHTIKVVATDASGNETVTIINDFFVTTNIWVRYYNNKTLFFGSIAGVLFMVAGLTSIVVYKKRNKKQTEKSK